tara:strand:- start:151 stop:768 length:618 start_codon:yes stop_codon:yes gene_type:complete
LVIKIGVLELQGDFALHHLILQKIGVRSIKVKKPLHLDGIDGLVIPGGESTTMSNLIETFKLREGLIDFSDSFPIMGTCAGTILMSNKVIDDDKINPLRLADFSIERNAYGRQIESGTEDVQFKFSHKIMQNLPATFIRAPRIKKLSEDFRVIGTLNDDPVAFISGNKLCLTFHPELDQIDTFHRILFDPLSDVYYKKVGQKHFA